MKERGFMEEFNNTEFVEMEAGAVTKKVSQASDPAEAKANYSKFGFGYLGAAILNVVAAVAILLIAMATGTGIENNATFRFAVSIATLYFIGLPFAYFMVNKIPNCEIGNKKLSFGQIISSLFIGYALIIGSNIVGTMFNSFFGQLTGKGIQNPIANAMSGLNPIFNICVVAILAPIMEELVFRKLLVDKLYKYGEGLTIIFSGLMFGLFHGNFAQFFYAFALGVYFAYIYMRTGRIRYTIYIHMFINGIGAFASIIVSKLDIEYIQELLFSGRVEEYMAYVTENMAAVGLLALYGFIVLCVSFVGLILMIVFHKKFHIDTIATALPKGTGARSLFGNPGMIGFILFFVISIVLAQFGSSISAVLMGLFG